MKILTANIGSQKPALQVDARFQLVAEHDFEIHPQPPNSERYQFKRVCDLIQPLPLMKDLLF